MENEDEKSCRDFFESLKAEGLNPEWRGFGARDDVVILSDGSKVDLVNPEIVSRLSGKQKIVSYAYKIVTAKRRLPK